MKPRFVQIAGTATRYTSRIYALDDQGSVWQWSDDWREDDGSKWYGWYKLGGSFGPPPAPAPTIEQQAEREVEELLS